MEVEQLASSVACSVFEKELNMRKAFSKYDADGDDTLDRTEFQVGSKCSQSIQCSRSIHCFTSLALTYCHHFLAVCYG
jgi:hypothetical protein